MAFQTSSFALAPLASVQEYLDSLPTQSEEDAAALSQVLAPPFFEGASVREALQTLSAAPAAAAASPASPVTSARRRSREQFHVQVPSWQQLLASFVDAYWHTWAADCQARFWTAPPNSLGLVRCAAVVCFCVFRPSHVWCLLVHAARKTSC